MECPNIHIISLKLVTHHFYTNEYLFIAIQSPLNQRWNTMGKIITVLPDHQYQIRVDGSGRITFRNHCFFRKCKLKPAPTPIPSATPVQITHSSNAPLLHPYPLTSSSNGTRTAIEPPKQVLWEPYPSHHNGLFSPLLVLRNFFASRTIPELSETVYITPPSIVENSSSSVQVIST